MKLLRDTYTSIKRPLLLPLTQRADDYSQTSTCMTISELTEQLLPMGKKYNFQLASCYANLLAVSDNLFIMCIENDIMTCLCLDFLRHFVLICCEYKFLLHLVLIPHERPFNFKECFHT